MALHVGGLTKKLVLDCIVDITAASVLRIYYEKPDGITRGFWVASEEADTQISYSTTATTDFDQTGLWKFQAWVVTPSWSLPGEMVEQLIESTIKETIGT